MVDRDVPAAIEAGLGWLLRHQMPDGRWSAAGSREQCAEGAECQCLDPSQVGPEAATLGDGDIATTSLVLTAIVGFGHTHRDGHSAKLKESAQRAIEWLLSKQQDSTDPAMAGAFCSDQRPGWEMEHAIAVGALSEILLLSRDRELLKEPVTDAVEWSLKNSPIATKKRTSDKAPEDAAKSPETLQVVWHFLALKGAKTCCLARMLSVDRDEVSDELYRIPDFFKQITDEKNGRVRPRIGADPVGADTETGIPCLTAGVALAEQLQGGQDLNPDLKRRVKALRGSLPRWKPRSAKRPSKIDPVYWYFGTHALFHEAGTSWKKWGPKVFPVLVVHQRATGCANGSWDPIGDSPFAHQRVAATALGVMTLEIFFRSSRPGMPEVPDRKWKLKDRPTKSKE